jgi:hypothetical protein
VVLRKPRKAGTTNQREGEQGRRPVPIDVVEAVLDVDRELDQVAPRPPPVQLGGQSYR